MDEPGEYRTTVDRLWREHLGTAFPAGLYGVEPSGIDLVLLDSTIAGCVTTWLNNDGLPDAERSRILRGRVADLGKVLPLITGPDELRYCRRLQKLAELASAPAS